jgi:NAD(P)-dependent dehydrogenase (short-subunit alcohol dehydrogenase family)
LTLILPQRNDRLWDKTAVSDGHYKGPLSARADIAEGFAYLASDAARKITGTLLTIDGGQLAG